MSNIVGGSKMSNVLKAKDDLLKTPEQLEAEKKEIIATRTVKLKLEGKSKQDLIQDVQQFYKILVDLHSYIYDLTERNMGQKYEMTELAERARQIEKGKSKKKSGQFTGLGGSVFVRLQEFFPQAPPKISLFSPFERVNDRRTMAERREMFNSKQLVEEIKEKPKSKFDNVATNENKKKSKKKKDEQVAGDEQDPNAGGTEDATVEEEQPTQPADETAQE